MVPPRPGRSRGARGNGAPEVVIWGSGKPMREFLLQAVGLAAFGTVADVVPLQDETRILVKHGLRRLKDQPVAGSQAMLNLAQ